MQDSTEIEIRLKGFDPQLCVAFAARCSLRILPLLIGNGGQGAFWYWDKGIRLECVLSVLISEPVN